MTSGLQRCVVWLLTVAVFGASARVRAQAIDPDAPARVVGKIVAPSGPMEFVDVPSADREAMRASAEGFLTIALRNPALNPPKGYDLRPSLYANGLLLGPRQPFIGQMTGGLLWYSIMPPYDRVQRLSVVMHDFSITANHPSLVFADRWQEDSDGLMYLEPREIRRVAGYPQYANGVVVLNTSGRPLWTPVARQRALRRELDVWRENLRTLDPAAGPAADGAVAQLNAWLQERPARQREADQLYEETKRDNPQLAEKMRANHAESEKIVEMTMRQLAEQEESGPAPLQARDRAARLEAEECVAYLEGELKRLSPAELAAQAYITLSASQRPAKPECSGVVDKTFPDAVGLVVPNARFFDPSLPRTALQLIMVDFTNFETPPPARKDWRHAVYESLRDGLDYQALAAMLVKR